MKKITKTNHKFYRKFSHRKSYKFFGQKCHRKNTNLIKESQRKKAHI